MNSSIDLLKILNKLENFRIKQRHEPFAEELDEPIERITDNFRSHLINALGDLQDLTKLMLKNEDLDFQEKIIFTETFCAQLYKRGGTYREGIKDVILDSRREASLPNPNKGLILNVDPDFIKSKGDIKPTSTLTQPHRRQLRRAPSPFTRYFDTPSFFRSRTRFFLMILVLFCLASIWSNILCFNFAVICIDGHAQGNGKEHPISADAYTLTTNEPNDDDDNESDEQKNLLRSPITMAVAGGALLANFPAVYLANRFGIRIIFTIFGLISAISTALIPSCIDWGFGYVIAARVFQGIAFACNFSAIGIFTSRWTYYKQSGLFVSTLVAFIQLSPTLTNPISGALCTSSLKWPAVFYGHAIACGIFFLLFLIFYRNNPEKHPFVNSIEAEKISRGKSTQLKEAQKNVPYKKILKTMSVWAVWVAALGNFFCVNLVFLFQPTYLHKVLGFGVKETGVTAALPPLLQFLLKLTAGFVSDKIHFMKETTKVKVFNSVAFFGSAILFIILSYIPPSNRILAFIVLVAAEGCLGISTGGFFKTSALVSRHYSTFVTGNIMLTINLTILIVSFMVNGIAKENTPEQWRIIFIITAIVLIWTNFFFICVGSAKPAPWTYDNLSDSSQNISPTNSFTGSYFINPSLVSPKPILRPASTFPVTRVDSSYQKPVGWSRQHWSKISRRYSMKYIMSEV